MVTGLLIFVLGIILGLTVSPWFLLLCVPVVIATWVAERPPWYLR